MQRVPYLSRLYRNATATALAALALVALPPSDSAAQSVSTLFEASARSTPYPAADLPAGVTRARKLAVRRDLMTALVTPGATAQPALDVNLFDDVKLRLERERLEIARTGHVTWVGRVQGDKDSTVALTWDGRVLTGGVVTQGRAYDITTTDGSVVVMARDTSRRERELAPRVARDANGSAGAEVPSLPSYDAAASIDLLVLYTPAAATRAGGVSQIQSQLANAVASTNTAFQRSGAGAVLNAVGIQQLSYTEGASLSTDLTAISGGGALNVSVEAARTAVGADLVALVTGRSSSSGGCGIAWLGPSSSAAFSVTEHACLYAGQWSFSHELGHNFGAGHAPGDSSHGGAPYAYGYREGSIRTLMAYAVAGSPARLLNFSSSSVLETGQPTGNSLQDNARRIAETAATVAGYRAGVGGGGGGGGGSAPAAPTSLSGVASGQTGIFSWSVVSGATSYVIQIGTSPGDSSVGSANLTSPSHVRTLSPGTYYWRVRAQNAVGTGPASAEASITVNAPPVLPGAPTGYSAFVNGRTVTLSFTPSTSGAAATSYELEVGSAPGLTNLGRFALSGSPSVFGNVPLGRYYTRVRARNAGGLSAPTADVLVTVGTPCVAPAATSISGSVSGNLVTLNWAAPSSGSGPFTYALVVGSQPGLSDIGVFGMGGANGYHGAPPPRVYFVKVVAQNACGTSPLSNEIRIAVP